MDAEVKVREARLRRMARRRGLQLVKSRRRDPMAVDYGGYMILDPDRNWIVAGELDSPRAMSLDEVEEWLAWPPDLTVEVSLESGCDEAECLAVAEVFEDAGVRAAVRGNLIRRSADLLPWIIDITVAGLVWKFLSAAVAGAGDDAGRDGWKWLRGVLTGLYEARRASRAPQGGVILRGEEEGVQIQLPPDLPDQAYRRLYEIENLEAPLCGVLVWNEEEQDWTDALQGKMRCAYPGCKAWATQSRVHRPTPTVTLSHPFCDSHAEAIDAGDLTAWGTHPGRRSSR